MTDIELATPSADIRRVAFLGTPHAAVPSLRALVEAGFDVPIVVSQPDRRRGRGSKLIPSPVKEAAIELGLEVADDPEVLLDVDDLDLAVVVAYGRILRGSILQQVPMINVHFSLLPRWRGAAPVERAILAGDNITGVCIMQVAEGLDEGAVYATTEVEIGFDETASELTDRLAALGAELLVHSIRDGLTDPRPQNGDTTYARKLDRAEAKLDFTQSASDIHRRVRIGRSWTTFRGARFGVEDVVPIDVQLAPGELKLLETTDVVTSRGDLLSDPVVAVGSAENSLALIEVKPEGRRAMKATDWWNGARPREGEQLGS